MALTKLTTDLANIQKLSDTPNTTEGLTADELKALWDKAGTDIQDYINDTLTAEIDSIVSPIGAIVIYPSDTIPTDWLLCNGQAVSRTTYSTLFSVLGTSHGSGDGSTTFNVPNMKGRTAVGKDSTDTDFDTLGETLGSKLMQTHTHDVPYNTGVGGNAAGYITAGATASTAPHEGWFGTTTVPIGVSAGNSGNIQPSIVENYIIRAK